MVCDDPVPEELTRKVKSVFGCDVVLTYADVKDGSRGIQYPVSDS